MGLEKSPELYGKVELLYNELRDSGIDILFDDRKVSPGFKLNDADLIGSPIRVIVGEKSMASGGCEMIVKDLSPVIVPFDEVFSVVAETVRKMKADLNQKVVNTEV